MPRDLFIYTHEFFPKRGGIATYCHEFASAAAQIEDNRQVVVIGPKGAATPDDTDVNYQLKQASNRGSHLPTCLWKTSRLLKENLQRHSKAIHLLAEPGPILAFGMLAAQHCHGQVQLIVHGSEVERWSKNPLSRIPAKRAFRRAHSIQAVSTAVLTSLIQHFPETRAKSTVVHNALPENFQRAAQRDHKDSMPSQQAAIQILSVGRIHPRKGYDQIIRALARLQSNDRARITYMIAGAAKDDAYLARLKGLAHSSNVQLQWVLNPNNDALHQCYANADIFALTSMPRKKSVEGFGIVYLEAGAYSLPCLAYDTGGVHEAVQDNVTGFLVKVGNYEKLSQQIRLLLENPKLRKQMGASNQAFARSRTWQQVVHEILK